jgi:hypothetical protein
MDTLIETTTLDGYRIEIYSCDADCDPRSRDNTGHMVCWHRRYRLGDDHAFASPCEFDVWWHKNGVNGIRLPLYLYNHSGITIATKPFSCPWDSGQVGWIYMTRHDLDNEYARHYPEQEWVARGSHLLQDEVNQYDQYVSGEVYAYAVTSADGTHVDTCCGIFGLDNARQAARDTVHRACREYAARNPLRESPIASP